ncbi:MAG TPA: hypothetical protein VJJ23_02295 [Candidatus Nanoarchaeia archaeon]|nr:hypothetical protein [Candidatus Nanoarchaeia archaeon]
MPDLYTKWNTFFNRIGATGDSLRYYRKIISLYNKPHRAYHDLIHIDFGLDELEEVRNLIPNVNKVEGAWWFHDSIYYPGKEDNEEKSAEEAYEFFKHIGLTNEFSKESSSLILLTDHHEIPGNLDGKFLTDIDLSIFGRPIEEFDDYERRIRMEHENVPIEIFKQKRKDILQRFLDRESIYLTDYFRKKYEDNAKRNLQRSIDKLSLR